MRLRSTWTHGHQWYCHCHNPAPPPRCTILFRTFYYIHHVFHYLIWLSLLQETRFYGAQFVDATYLENVLCILRPNMGPHICTCCHPYTCHGEIWVVVVWGLLNFFLTCCLCIYHPCIYRRDNDKGHRLCIDPFCSKDRLCTCKKNRSIAFTNSSKWNLKA